MSKRVLLVLSLLFVTLPLYADFNSIERALRSELGAPTWIPFLGLARVASNVVHPNGVHDFQLAVFEHGRFDGHQAALLLSREAPGFSPLVKSQSHGEWTLVFCRPEANGRVELLILTSDSHETVLVRCDLDAATFARSMDKPETLASVTR